MQISKINTQVSMSTSLPKQLQTQNGYSQLSQAEDNNKKERFQNIQKSNVSFGILSPKVQADFLKMFTKPEVKTLSEKHGLDLLALFKKLNNYEGISLTEGYRDIGNDDYSVGFDIISTTGGKNGFLASDNWSNGFVRKCRTLDKIFRSHESLTTKILPEIKTIEDEIRVLSEGNIEPKFIKEKMDKMSELNTKLENLKAKRDNINNMEKFVNFWENIAESRDSLIENLSEFNLNSKAGAKEKISKLNEDIENIFDEFVS